jgi:hypothetical protein
VDRLRGREPDWKKDLFRAELAEAGKSSVEEKSGGAPANARDARLLDEAVPVPSASHLELKFHVEVGALGFDRGVFIGLCPEDGSFAEAGFGVFITRSGGPGRYHRTAGLVWDGMSGLPASPLQLEEGKVYDVALLEAGGGRTYLRVEEIAPSAAAEARFAAGSRRASSLTFPRLDFLGPSPVERGGRSLASLPASGRSGRGNWRFVIAEAGSIQSTTLLTFREIELRLLPVAP